GPGRGPLDTDARALPAPGLRAGRQCKRRRRGISGRRHGRRLDLDVVDPVRLKPASLAFGTTRPWTAVPEQLSGAPTSGGLTAAHDCAGQGHAGAPGALTRR